MKGMSNSTLLFFSDNWDYRWRRRQQLASGLSKTGVFNKVIYIERPLTLTSFVKFLFRCADWESTNRWKEVLHKKSWVRSISNKLDVFTTFSILPVMKFNVLFNIGEAIRSYWFLSRVRRFFNIDRPVVWISHPQISIKQIKALNPSFIVYDCTEDFSAWPDIPECVRRQIKETDSYLTEHADVITCVSHILFDEKKRHNPNTYLLPNAVDIDIYSRPKEEYAVPSDIQQLNHPIITFVGAMQEWSNDWGLLIKMAEMRPLWTFLLIGPFQNSKRSMEILQPYKNILCLGLKPYEELPSYLVHSDVCFQFYRPARENDTRNSQKLFLYLAAGKPIVSTRSADVGNYAEFVALADDADNFVKCIENELKTDSTEKISKRKEYAKNNSWSNRVDEIVKILTKNLGQHV